MSSPDKVVSSGVKWSLAAYGGTQLIRLASNLVLTRLLFPEAFGTMLIINTVIIGLELFSDIGITPSIVQNKRGDEPDFLRTAWTIQIIRGIILFLIVCALSIPLSNFYEIQELKTLLPFAGLTAIFNGFLSTSIPTYRRHMRLKELTLIKLGQQVLSTIIMIGWAVYNPSVWALAGGNVIATFVFMLLSYTLLENIKHKIQLEKNSLKALIRFGRWIFLSTLIMYLVGYSDRLIISKLMTLDIAGVYALALIIAAAPSAAAGAVFSNVAFPVFSKIYSTDNDLQPHFQGIRQPINIISGWAVCGLIAVAPFIIRTFWTEPYWGAAPMVQIILLGIYPGVILVGSNNAALLAMGHSRLTAGTSMAKLIAMIIFTPIGYMLFGMFGLLAGLALSEFCRYIASVIACKKHSLSDTGHDVSMGLRVITIVIITYILSDIMENSDVDTIYRLIILATTVTVAWLGPLLLILKKIRSGKDLFAIET